MFLQFNNAPLFCQKDHKTLARFLGSPNKIHHFHHLCYSCNKRIAHLLSIMLWWHISIILIAWCPPEVLLDCFSDVWHNCFYFYIIFILSVFLVSYQWLLTTHLASIFVYIIRYKIHLCFLIILGTRLLPGAVCVRCWKGGNYIWRETGLAKAECPEGPDSQRTFPEPGQESHRGQRHRIGFTAQEQHQVTKQTEYSVL